MVKELLNRKDVDTIYYAGDSAREGEYIQRLVRSLAGHNKNAIEKRVWIDSQTEEEIRNGIQNAKNLSYYDTLSDSAYARAIEDYAIGINFSRALTLKYAYRVAHASGKDRTTVAVGRVMSCVLGMVVRREREIRENVKTMYYTVNGTLENGLVTNWKPRKDSSMYTPEELYNISGFLKEPRANQFISQLNPSLTLKDLTFTSTQKYAPLLFNLAELQGECTKLYHISPDETLKVAQSLYEKKLTTYPRTDARVLTTAIDKVIDRNIRGLMNVPDVTGFAGNVLVSGTWKTIDQTKYTNDAAVSDHYAIIPTGDTSGIGSLSQLERDIYILICRRFLSVFYPPAQFTKMSAVFTSAGENFTCGAEDLVSPGWMEVAQKIPNTSEAAAKIKLVRTLVKGNPYPASYDIRQAETQPPKRYTTGSMVLAMENAGKLIEDEELREQIKGSGIGTSATRAETIKKLISNGYIQADKKQVISPTLLGEAIYEIIALCASQMLSPEITASWEKGLAMIVSGDVTKEEYLDKMYQFIRKTTEEMKNSMFGDKFDENMKKVYPYYKGAENAVQQANGVTDCKCPKCGAPMKRIPYPAYFCTSCDYKLWPKFAQKMLTDKQLQVLLSGKMTSEIKGLKKRDGGTFSAKLRLGPDGVIEFAR